MKYFLSALAVLVMILLGNGTAEAMGNGDMVFGYVEDKGGILGDEEAAGRRLEEAAEYSGWCIGICTGVPLDSGESIYDGIFGGRDGILLCINKGYAKVISRGSAAEYVRDVRAENIVRLTERALRHNRGGDIPDILARRLEGLRRKGAGGFDLYPPAFAIALAAAFAAGFGTVFWISRRYSPGEPPAVNNYLDVRSIDYYRKTDTQLFAKSVSYQNNIIQQMVRGEGVFRRRR